MSRSWPARPSRVRVVVAGFGDTGLMTAVNLARHHRLVDVVGISSTPGWLSSRDLGLRLARPERWAAQYDLPFFRFRALDRARLVHGTVSGLDLAARAVTVLPAGGGTTREPYDVLVIATGVRNGFWRSPDLRERTDIEESLRATHARFAAAESIAVVGGGPAATGSAAQFAETFPHKRIDLYFPGTRALARHHHRVWDQVRPRLEQLGVRLHPRHRAEIPPDPSPAPGPVHFTTGQPPAEAGLVLWATGRVRPNTGWLPADLLDADGFVRVEADLRVPGHDGVWAVGDVAASDPLRSSARNRGAELVARNIVASLRGRGTRTLRPTPHAHGSVFGALRDSLEYFTPGGSRVRLPTRVNDAMERFLIAPLLYRGIRPAEPRQGIRK